MGKSQGVKMINAKLFYQSMVFHSIDKHVDFERGYYNLKIAMRGFK